MRWPVLSTDELRKERAGLDVAAPALARPDEGLYTPALRAATYDELVEHAARLVAHGESVVLDASWSAAAIETTASPLRCRAEALRIVLGFDPDRGQ